VFREIKSGVNGEHDVNDEKNDEKNDVNDE
jgi:hypothetical protein